MKKIGLAFVVFAAIGSAMSITQAMPGTLQGQLNAAADSLKLVEKTQFFIGSQEYCWYDDAWNGPGWYWCGYATRQGFGWGGSSGWHNWDRHHPPVHGPGSSHNPIIRDPVHGAGSSHPVHGTGSSHNPTHKPIFHPTGITPGKINGNRIPGCPPRYKAPGCG